MVKNIFLTTLVATILLHSNAFATLTSQQQTTLKAAGIKNYQIIKENKDYTILSTDNSFITFFGQTNNFSIERIYTYDAKNKLIIDVIDKEMINELAKYKYQYINIKASPEKLHVYVIVNIACGYCHKLFEDVPKFVEQGISFTFVPYIHPKHDKEDLKVSYILNQKAENRFTWLRKAPKDIPEAIALNQNITPTMAIMDKYLIKSYPYLVTQHGMSIPGYESFASHMQYLKYFTK